MTVNRKKWFLSILAVCCIFFTNTVRAAPADITVTGTGISETAAIQDAMRNALEQRVGVLVDSSTLSQNASIVHDMIYTHTEGYILGYSILQSSQYDDGYHVTLKAAVSDRFDSAVMSKFQKAKAINLGFQDARIGVIITGENTITEYDGAENVIIDGLQQAGLGRIIDLKQLDAAEKNRIASALFHDDYDTVEALKTQFAVDFMVVGRYGSLSANNVKSSGFEGFVNGRAILAIRMYNMNTGEILSADTITAAALHTDRQTAMSLAMSKAASKAIPKLTKSVIQKAVNPEQHVQLLVTEGKLGDTRSAQQRLSAIRGISNVFLRSNTYGTMIFDLNYYGNAVTLSEALEADGITILEATASYIKI